MPPNGFDDACNLDKNNDGLADALDDALFITAFGLGNPTCDPNGDGWVGMADLRIVLRLFGQPPGPSGLDPICEPARL